MPNHGGFVRMLTNLIEAHIKKVHTAFIGKIVKVDDDLTVATVQPLAMTKVAGEKITKYPVLSGVPILPNARRYYTGTSEATAKLKKGCIVLCVCCERDISDAIRGVCALPAKWHHSMTDAIIVGVMQ